MHLVQKVQIETPSPQTDAEYNNRTVNSCGEHGMEEGPVHQWAAFTVHQGLGLKEARDSRQCAWFQLLLSCAFRVRAFCYCLILKIAQIFPGCAVVYIEENGYHFIIIIAAIICAYYTHDEGGGSLRESSWWWSRRCWLFCSPVTKWWIDRLESKRQEADHHAHRLYLERNFSMPRKAFPEYVHLPPGHRSIAPGIADESDDHLLSCFVRIG